MQNDRIVNFFIRVAIRSPKSIPLLSDIWLSLPTNSLLVYEWREHLIEIDAKKGSSTQTAIEFYDMACRALRAQYGSGNIHILSGMLQTPGADLPPTLPNSVSK
jgi:hypothetical protein